MNASDLIYIAGHRGLVGSAMVRSLRSKGFDNLLLRSSSELDLRDPVATEALFAQNKPSYVVIAAAKVGGIVANNTYPVEFLLENTQIQNNVISAAHRHGVKRLLFLGSSCIYPKLAPQPLREEYLLTGPLESTNRAYALAKISGVELCWSYNREYGAQFVSVMPTNLYGPADNYHPQNSHVIPGLIRKFHDAATSGADTVTVWGTGRPRREFLHSDDMAAACTYLLQLEESRFGDLLGADETESGVFSPPLVNVGMGSDVSIAELAELIARVTGFKGKIVYDTSKPDGTPQKLLDVSRMSRLGWQASTALEQGLSTTYRDFVDNVLPAERAANRNPASGARQSA